MEFYLSTQTDSDRAAAIDDSGSELSFRELADFSKLVKISVKPRTLLFALCENSIGSLAGCAAFLNNRIVPLLLGADLDGKLLGSLLQAYRPDFLWLPASKRGDFPELTICLEVYGYVLLKTQYAEQPQLHDDLALLLTTSGSTGSRKLVRVSYKNLRSNGESISEYLGIGPEDRPITSLPMHYSYGFSIINSHLMAGATILLTEKTLVEKGFWAFFRDQRATSLSGVPYTFEMLNQLRFIRMKLPSLRTITQAGGKLSVELAQKFSEYAVQNEIRFFIMYGQTEASPRISYVPAEKALDKCSSIGIAIPGGELFLVDDNGIPIDQFDREGELAYKGDNVSMGYAKCREDLCKGDERGGVLLTGDIAYRDSEGFYYITGRKHRFIKLYGNRVNLDEAEQIVKELVPECACCGTDDHMAIFITEPGLEGEVRKRVAIRTGINPAAFTVSTIVDIPKNEAGKTLYAQLDCPGALCST